MIDAAVQELRERGVAGMSFTRVLEASGAARGAIYHHFPGGKAELVAEAATANGAQVSASLATLPAGTPAELVEAFLAAVRPVVAASAGGSGCAVAAVALGATDDDKPLRDIAAEVFADWTQTLTRRLTDAGMTAEDATALATTLLALLEGAHVLCRATGDIAPFDRVAETTAGLVSPAR
jgi:TetR/AcrR family transcriptional repressor of lmrAB and yxaGH operons